LGTTKSSSRTERIPQHLVKPGLPPIRLVLSPPQSVEWRRLTTATAAHRDTGRGHLLRTRVERSPGESSSRRTTQGRRSPAGPRTTHRHQIAQPAVRHEHWYLAGCGAAPAWSPSPSRAGCGRRAGQAARHDQAARRGVFRFRRRGVGTAASRDRLATRTSRSATAQSRLRPERSAPACIPNAAGALVAAHRYRQRQ
jgi:hypothetical protein